MVIFLKENGAEDILISKCRKIINICQNVQNNIPYAMSEGCFEFRGGNIKKKLFRFYPMKHIFLKIYSTHCTHLSILNNIT